MEIQRDGECTQNPTDSQASTGWTVSLKVLTEVESVSTIPWYGDYTVVLPKAMSLKTMDHYLL